MRLPASVLSSSNGALLPTRGLGRRSQAKARVRDPYTLSAWESTRVILKTRSDSSMVNFCGGSDGVAVCGAE
jgi:hypothetical protein